LVLQDVSDIFLEGAKVFKYFGLEMLATVTFAFMACTWAFTRMFLFSTVAIRTAYWDSAAVLGTFPGFYTANAFLWVLQCLHIYWFWLIIRVVRKALTSQGKVDDNRSESDTE